MRRKRTSWSSLPKCLVRLIPTDFIGTHSISYLSDYIASFFSRSVKSLSPSYSAEHRVTVYAIDNPQPNQVCHKPRFPGYPIICKVKITLSVEFSNGKSRSTCLAPPVGRQCARTRARLERPGSGASIQRLQEMFRIVRRSR